MQFSEDTQKFIDNHPHVLSEINSFRDLLSLEKLCKQSVYEEILSHALLEMLENKPPPYPSKYSTDSNLYYQNFPDMYTHDIISKSTLLLFSTNDIGSIQDLVRLLQNNPFTFRLKIKDNTVRIQMLKKCLELLHYKPIGLHNESSEKQPEINLEDPLLNDDNDEDINETLDELDELESHMNDHHVSTEDFNHEEKSYIKQPKKALSLYMLFSKETLLFLEKNPHIIDNISSFQDIVFLETQCNSDVYEEILAYLFLENFLRKSIASSSKYPNSANPYFQPFSKMLSQNRIPHAIYNKLSEYHVVSLVALKELMDDGLYKFRYQIKDQQVRKQVLLCCLEYLYTDCFQYGIETFNHVSEESPIVFNIEEQEQEKEPEEVKVKEEEVQENEQVKESKEKDQEEEEEEEHQAEENQKLLEKDLFIDKTKNIVFQDMNLNEIEKQIKNELAQCDIWSDLNLSYESYQYLTEKIKEMVSGRPLSHYIESFRLYPVTFTTQIIYFAIYDYVDELWKPWADLLEIPIKQSFGKIGSEINRVFDNHHIKYDKDGYTYVTPILSQCGVPTPYLDDFFDILQENMDQLIDPFAIIDEMKGWRSYQIHKPVQRYILYYPDKAVELINELSDIMHRDIDDEADGNKSRYITRYNEWKRITKEQKRNSRQKNYFSLPELYFTEEAVGLFLRFHSIRYDEEYAQELIWKIYHPGNEQPINIIHTPLRSDELGCYSIEKDVLFLPKDEFTITVCDDLHPKKIIKTATVEGFGNKPFLLFNENGKRIHDDFIPNTFGYLILQNDFKIDFVEMNTYQIDLPKKLNSVKAYYISPISTHSSVSISGQSDKPYTLDTRFSINISFEGGQFFFNESPKPGEIPLFTNIPDIHLGVENIVYIENCMLYIHHRQSGHKISHNLSTIQDDSLTIHPLALIKNNGMIRYGTYDVKIYKKGKFIASNSFILVPLVNFDESKISPWPIANELKASSFAYQDTPDVQLSIVGDPKIRKEKRKESIWFELEIPKNKSEVYGTIEVACNPKKRKYHWHKTLYNMSWSIWGEESEEIICSNQTQSFTKEEIVRYNFWLTLWILTKEVDGDIFLSLSNARGSVLQSNSVKPSRHGKYKICLGAFVTTIQNTETPLYLHLKFHSKGILQNILLVRVIDHVSITNLQRRIVQSGYILDFSAEKKPSTNLVLQNLIRGDSNIEIPPNLIRSKGDGYFYVSLSKPLQHGLYILTLNEKKEEFFLQETKKKLPDLKHQSTLLISDKEFRTDKSNSIKGLLALAIMYYKNIEKIKILYGHMEKYHDKFHRIHIGTNELYCILILAHNVPLFSNGEINYCHLILKLLSRYFIKDVDRSVLIAEIPTFDITDKTRKLLFYALDLLFFKPSSDIDLHKVSLENIELFGIEFQLIWLFRFHQYSTIGEKIMRVFGYEALKNMIIIPQNDSSDAFEDFRQYIYDLPRHKDKLELRFTKDLVGDKEIMNAMIQYNQRGIPFIERKPQHSNQILFCGCTYVDLFVEMYRSTQLKKDLYKKVVLDLGLAQQLLDQTKNELILLYPKITKIFFAAMEKYRRISENYGIIPFFYYSSIACMYLSLRSHSLYSHNQVSSIKAFTSTLAEFCPNLVLKDTLLAELIIFIKGEK